MKQFTNRPNRRIIHEGHEYWISRSVAVTAVLFFQTASDGKWYVPLSLRGTAMLDGVGQWCLPSGYLDWDETIFEGLCREVWEETGIDIETYVKQQYADTDYEQPIYIASVPHGRQTISCRYCFHIVVDTLPSLTLDYTEPNESDAIQRFSVEDAVAMDLAFHHNALLTEHFREI